LANPSREEEEETIGQCWEVLTVMVIYYQQILEFFWEMVMLGDLLIGVPTFLTVMPRIAKSKTIYSFSSFFLLSFFCFRLGYAILYGISCPFLAVTIIFWEFPFILLLI
jgi:hypothetical protein